MGLMCSDGKARVDAAQRADVAGGVPLAVPHRPRRPKVARESLDPIVRALVDEREERGLARSDVTRAIGGSASDVSRWERGLTEPSLQRLRKWAASLGCDVVLVPRTPSASTPGEGS